LELQSAVVRRACKHPAESSGAGEGRGCSGSGGRWRTPVPAQQLMQTRRHHRQYGEARRRSYRRRGRWTSRARVWIIFQCRATTSSVSGMSSPSLASLPQHGQVGAPASGRARAADARARGREPAAPRIGLYQRAGRGGYGLGRRFFLGRARLQLLELRLELVEQPAAGIVALIS